MTLASPFVRALRLMRAAAIGVALGFAGAAPAAATGFDLRSGFSADEAREARTKGDTVSMSTAIDNVRRRYPGARVVDAGQPAPHRIVVRIITRDGRRLDVRVDARTGQVIGAEER